MCFPVSCLKYVLSFFAAITIVIGLAGIIFGSVELAKQGKVDFSDFDATQISTILLLGTGIIALFVGIIGMVGTQKKSKCCLCIYQFSVFPMVCLSLALACLATYSTYMVSEMSNVEDQLSQCDWQKPTDDCKQCGNDGILEWIRNMNTNIFDVTTEVLGKQDGCTILAGSVPDQKIYEGYGYNVVTEAGNGVVTSALDCSLSSSQKNAGKFISYFEQEFKCSGLCTPTPFYAFYNTSLPINVDNYPSCYEKITHFLDSSLVTGISWGIFAYFLLNMVLACCLCCHPERKQQQNGNAYSRMNYYD